MTLRLSSDSIWLSIELPKVGGSGSILLITKLNPMRAPRDVPNSGETPFTDYSRWRLDANDGGRHIWHYLKTDEEVEQWPQNTVDKYWLGLPTVATTNYHASLP